MGDSLTQWLGNTPFGGGLFGPLGRFIRGQQAANYFAGNAYRGGSPPYDLLRTYLMPWSQDGKSGTGIADLAANVQTRVINPLLAGGAGRSGHPILIHQCSINDGSNMSQGTWDAAGGSAYFTALKNAVGSLRILMLPVPFAGRETWDGVNTWTAADAGINASNVFYASVAAAQGAWWYDWRGQLITDANTALNAESIANPGGTWSANQAGSFTYDGTHPIDTSGEEMLCNCLINGALSISY